MTDQISRMTSTFVAATLGGIVALAAVLGYQAVSADHDANTTHACVPRFRIFTYPRIVDSPSDCFSWENALQWGAEGPQGTPGSDGADGINGANGVSGYEVVTQDLTLPGGSVTSPTVACPDGKVALSGGYSGLAGANREPVLTDDLELFTNFPFGTGWSFQLSSHSAFAQDVRVYVVCALATP